MPDRPPVEERKNHPRERDILNAIFPKGYDSAKERFARKIASEIGYAKLSEDGNGVIDEVGIDDIYPCQGFVNHTKIVEMMIYMRDNEVPGFPVGIRIGEDVYLIDGHHRVSAQILMGRKTVMMRITDIRYEAT